MSSIKLTDNYDFSVDVTNEGANGSLFKRLLTDAEFCFDTANLRSVGPLPLGANPRPVLPFTLTVKGSAGIGAKGLASLKIDSTCKAKLSKSVGDGCSKTLDEFDEKLPEGADAKTAGYLSFETSAEVNTGVSGTVNEFTFGLTEGRSVTLANSKYFPDLPSAGLLDATRALLMEFVVPAEVSDLQSLPVENICSVAGKGSLRFKASFGYQLFTNPLTSVDIPVAGSLAVKASGKADLDFTISIAAGFKVSVLKNSDHTVRLSVERSRDLDFDTGINVNAQVTATVMGQDLLSLLLGAISPNPDKELDQVKATLGGDERDAINDAIKKAIEDNCELASQADIETELQTDTLFLYELDLNALTERGRAAAQAAFHGDFTQLSQATANDGVTVQHSVLTDTTTLTRRLTVHVLNAFQAGSISALISKETVKALPNGDLTITDKATAQSLDFVSLAGRGDGLRKLFFTSAIITSAYRVTGGQGAAPDIKCALVHFDYEQKASIDDLRRNLNALQMLQVVSDDQAASALNKAKNQKAAASTIDIRLNLSEQDCERLFLDDNKARRAEVYETAAKSAMYRLIAGDPNQAELAQLLTTAKAALWNNLKTADTVSDMAVKLETDDMMIAQRYFTEVARIKWWTEHMSALSGYVAAFRAAGPQLDQKSPTFQKLHKRLQDEAKAVSGLSEDYFKLPWGILATSQVLGFDPKVEVTYASQPFSIRTSAAPARVAVAR